MTATRIALVAGIVFLAAFVIVVAFARHAGPRRGRRGHARRARSAAATSSTGATRTAPPPRPGSGPPRRPTTGPPTVAADARRATAEAARRGERYCPLDPLHSASAPPPTAGEPLPRQGRRPAHLPPGRGRPHRRLPDRAPRQGARRRQGRAPHHLEVRRPPRAADPRRPPAVAGEERPRHREPGRGAERVPAHPRGPRPDAPRHRAPRGDRPDGPGAPPRPPPLRDAGRRPAAPWPTTRSDPTLLAPAFFLKALVLEGAGPSSMCAPPAASPTAPSSWWPSTSSRAARCAGPTAAGAP